MKKKKLKFISIAAAMLAAGFLGYYCTVGAMHILKLSTKGSEPSWAWIVFGFLFVAISGFAYNKIRKIRILESENHTTGAGDNELMEGIFDEKSPDPSPFGGEAHRSWL